MPHSSPLQTAIEAAIAAGDIIRRKFPQTREIKSKGWRDIVTDADFAAQKTISRIITRRFPDHAFLSEEGRHDIDLSAPIPTWVVDPLDGTTNYSHRFPSFSVAIALAHHGEMQIGVVHDPLRAETYFAEKGRGAFVRGAKGRARSLHVSTLTDLGDSLIAVDWARKPEVRERIVAALSRVAADCRSIRAIGSAELGLAYIAAGYLDGYYHLALQPWDVAAGALLVTEAGGKISTPSGSTWHLGNPEAVASNGKLHGALVKSLGLGD